MQELPVISCIATAYALAIIGGSWFILPSDRRAHQRHRIHARFSDLRIGLRLSLRRISQKTTSAYLRTTTRARIVITFALPQWRTACIAFAILIGPAVLAWTFFTDKQYDDYVEPPSLTGPVIAGLLRGEQLVPPAPIPPELFSTREVERDRRQIALASREWERLDADFRKRLLVVYHLLAKHGYQMTLLEGYRSPERQAALAKIGTHVTYAGANQSYHQHGLAADSAFYKDGKLLISEKDPWAMEGYRLYGRYAESVGLVWGGKWQMRDFGHVELRRQRLPDKNQRQMLHDLQQ